MKEYLHFFVVEYTVDMVRIEKLFILYRAFWYILYCTVTLPGAETFEKNTTVL
jgi:hypothetical protein